MFARERAWTLKCDFLCLFLIPLHSVVNTLHNPLSMLLLLLRKEIALVVLLYAVSLLRLHMVKLLLYVKNDGIAKRLHQALAHHLQWLSSNESAYMELHKWRREGAAAFTDDYYYQVSYFSFLQQGDQ